MCAVQPQEAEFEPKTEGKKEAGLNLVLGNVFFSVAKYTLLGT